MTIDELIKQLQEAKEFNGGHRKVVINTFGWDEKSNETDIKKVVDYGNELVLIPE